MKKNGVRVTSEQWKIKIRLDLKWVILGCSRVNFSPLIVYYAPMRITRVITRRATMLAGDRSQGVVEAKPSRDHFCEHFK